MARIRALGLALLLAGAGPARAEGDAGRGARVFARCRPCHVADQPQNRVGPHLVGLFGRKAGSVEGFRYSEAMQSSGIVWDAATLDAYLAAPRDIVPRNRMAFPGLRQAEERADLIAHLRQVTAP
jgi:cytochrome c2